MSLKEMLQRMLTTYFVLVTCITAAILILGNIFDPGAVLTYNAYFSPLLFAALGVIPEAVTFSSKELSVREAIVRKMIQLLLIEGEILGVCIWSPSIRTEDIPVTAGIAVSVFIIYILANAVSALNDYFAAKKLTEELMSFKKSAE